MTLSRPHAVLQSLFIFVTYNSIALGLPAVPQLARIGNSPQCTQAYSTEITTQAGRYLEDIGVYGQYFELVASRKLGTAYVGVPSVYSVNIVQQEPIPIDVLDQTLSAGMTDPILLEARYLNVFEDLKLTADAVPRQLSERERAEHYLAAEEKGKEAQEAARSQGLPADAVVVAGKRAFLKSFILQAYSIHRNELTEAASLAPAQWQVDASAKGVSPEVAAAFAYAEGTMGEHLKTVHVLPGSSILPAPFPIAVPAGRFQEQYGWDPLFAVMAWVTTGRNEIAKMQVENKLYNIERYGFDPNGGREYYLTREHPHVSTSMVRTVYEAELANPKGVSKGELRKWLAERAYPLLKAEYLHYWKVHRRDERTGLFFHGDEVNMRRPERHGNDSEEALGKTYLDVRAACATGKDFTDTHEGEASHIAGVLGNSMTHKALLDLVWMAEQLGLEDEAAFFKDEAASLKESMNRYMWNEAEGRFEDYHLVRGRRMGYLLADNGFALFGEVATPAQAVRIRDSLRKLERPGGLAANELRNSPHQWDGNNGWPPFQVATIEGYRKYGFKEDMTRLAWSWVNALSNIYAREQQMPERIDVGTASTPAVDEHKYPVQKHFLWTKGSFVWLVVDVLKIPIARLQG